MNQIEYQSAKLEVGKKEYSDWLENHKVIDKLIGTTEAEKDVLREWATYNALIDSGHFVSKPSEIEPESAKIFYTPAEGTSFPVYEEGWTKEKILAERAKLLKEKELWLNKKEETFKRKVQKFHENKEVVSNSSNNSAGWLVILMLGLFALTMFFFVIGQVR